MSYHKCQETCSTEWAGQEDEEDELKMCQWRCSELESPGGEEGSEEDFSKGCLVSAQEERIQGFAKSVPLGPSLRLAFSV